MATALSLLVLILVAAQTNGHGILEDPAPRDGATIAGNNKGRGRGPCGVNAQAQKGAVAQTYTAGDQVQVSWRTAIPHGGIARVSISREDGADEPTDFQAGALTADIPCCTARETETAQITIPADFADCASCTLQWFWAGDSDYFDCSDITVNALPQAVDDPPPGAGDAGGGAQAGGAVDPTAPPPLDYTGAYPIEAAKNMVPDGEGANPGVCCQLDAGAVIISDPLNGQSVTVDFNAQVLECDLLPGVTEVSASATLEVVPGVDPPGFLGPIILSDQEFVIGAYVDPDTSLKQVQWRNAQGNPSWVICNGVADFDPSYSSFDPTMAAAAAVAAVIACCLCLCIYMKLKGSSNRKQGRYPPGRMGPGPGPRPGMGGAPPMGMAPGGLPPGWSSGTDPASGQAYYISPTGMSQWNRP